MRRLQLQLMFVLGAALSVTVLSGLLISNAIRGAERVVIADTRKTLATANTKLDERYSYHVSSEPSWSALPSATRDAFLRSVTESTLKAYPGVEGGFFVNGKILGYSYPTHGSGTPKIDVPEAELHQIKAAIQQARTSGHGEQILRGSRDLVVIEALSHADYVSWTMKRLAGFTDPGKKKRSIFLICLVIAAFISVSGTLATVFGLRHGLADIQEGLAKLETDLDFELPAKPGELGHISESVNRVAAARRKLEGELRREDRLRIIGRFAANIAHEIRNPLNGLRLAMQMLKRKLTHGDIRQSDLDLVIEEVDRLNALLTDLLSFRKPQKPSLQLQPVLPVVERCVQLIEGQAQNRSIEIRVLADDPNVRATVDAKQLTQVLTNLLLNSTAAISQEGNIDIFICRKQKSVVIEIHDSGPGVAPEQREHLFDAFYTTRTEGTGLGLAVSRELVQGMDGTITYRDGAPGAIFSVTFTAEEVAHETSSRR